MIAADGVLVEEEHKALHLATSASDSACTVRFTLLCCGCCLTVSQLAKRAERRAEAEKGLTEAQEKGATLHSLYLACVNSALLLCACR